MTILVAILDRKSVLVTDHRPWERHVSYGRHRLIVLHSQVAAAVDCIRVALRLRVFEFLSVRVFENHSTAEFSFGRDLVR